MAEEHEADSNQVHTTSTDTTPRERILTLDELNKKQTNTNEVSETIAYVPNPADDSIDENTGDSNTTSPQPTSPQPLSNELTSS